jgi:hypothetical protein
MALKNIIITGSIGTYPTLSYGQKMYISSTDEESFPIEKAIGSNGGSMPNLFGQTSSVDLYSNINQQWSGSTLTPVGMVDYIHLSQDEFVNGEFSGSALEVSHQSLVDPQCETFLEVNTTEINYSIFIYNSLYSKYDSSPGLKVGNFTNSVVAPNNGEIFILNSAIATAKPAPMTGYYETSNSLTYIKISRFDKQGNDNTLSLQELTKLIVKFTDIGIIDLPLFTISEYPTYYLYTTYYPTGIGYVYPPTTFYPFSTTNNNAIMHQLVAAAGTYYIPPTSTYNGNTLVASIDNNSCFNPITGLYTFNDTPNVEIYYTGSFAAVSSFWGSMELYGDTSFLGTSTYFVAGNRYKITGSIFPVKNQQYTFKVTNAGGTGATIDGITFELTQSISPNTASNLTVLEPYLTSNFYYSDCNVLINNALDLEYDSNFRQVNYDTGYVIPSNQAQILNGTAEIAPVKSYNYSLQSQIVPRYVGCKQIQQNPNVWTLGDVAPSKTPSVQSLGTYFAYFTDAGGTNPEIINMRGCKIKYLIDSSGSVITPTLNSGSSYLPNLIDSFPGGQNVNIVPYVATGDVSQIQGVRPVLQPGVLPKAIIYTQTSSLNNFVSTMSFAGSLIGIPNYGTNIGQPYYVYANDNYYNILDINTQTVNWVASSVTWNSSAPDRNLEINTPSSLTQVIPTITLTLENTQRNNIDSQVILRILKYAGGSWSQIASKNIIVQNRETYTLSSSPQTITTGDKYRATLEYIKNQNTTITQYNGTFTLTQTTPPTLQQVTASFWQTGSASKNILTGSVYLNSDVYNLYQQPIANAGYSGDNLPFNIQRLDEIRFIADENQTYQILAVSSPFESSDGRLYLTLDRNIVNGVNLNSFLIRRLTPDPNYVIMNVPATGGGLSGFLFPEFITPELKNNLPSIIADLQQKNLIQ